mmetsp:Transcript_25614/g.74101  ORF Transcript_25614/g.74101 Transcript_25614/m.74101 type:complete len:272 (-) Transcript_25614:1159-1974(-)
MPGIPRAALLGASSGGSEVGLKDTAHLFWFIQQSTKCCLVLFFGEQIEQRSIQPPLLSLGRLTFLQILFVNLLKLLDQKFHVIIRLFVGMNIEQNGNNRRSASLFQSVLNHVDLIFHWILLSVHVVLRGELDVHVRYGKLIAPTLWHVGRGSKCALFPTALVTETFISVGESITREVQPQLAGQDLFLQLWVGGWKVATLVADLMELKALLGGDLVGHIDRRLTIRFALALVGRNVMLDIGIEFRPVGTLTSGRPIGKAAPHIRTVAGIVF